MLPVNRILVRGVNWLGDAVMTTPALQRLREHFPQATIAMLAPEKLRDLWKGHPAVDEVITFNPRDGVWRVASRIRASKVPFDLALIFPNSPRSALEIWLARIPRRIGHARPWRNWLLTDRVPERPGRVVMRKRSATEIRSLVSNPTSNHGIGPNPAAHQIHDYLHLTAFLGANAEPVAPRLDVAPAESAAGEAALISEARAKWKDLSSDSSLVWLGLNPSAAYGPAKRWPAERFAEVARRVCERFPNAVWLAMGGPDDAALCDEIIRLANARVLNRAGKTGLRELMVELKLCRVVLTNDSGPMHVAAALGSRVVVPFGSTSPILTGPGLPGDAKHRLLFAGAACSPCFLRECPIDFRCMTGISTDAVFEAVCSMV